MMHEMMQEIEDIERSTLPKDETSSATKTTRGTVRQKSSKMDDLLQEMQKLSAKHKEVDSSNKEEYECASTTSNLLFH